ncbi:(Dimethylallyl)adenosine tRNA methylthiotransferase MiaB [Carbonactinospora thermoautotrophica]|uniref:(Dimethylallyl)adenosine tRNA methylthiotransferase MiaB n=1 Tax=Carbonactinospora thermoautotrophica TaxID=1469144 RepID=A0A132MPG8_9ACTN|nr:(Dimethylallyl)adenosine tRNA methylthiotransferase MiaB [Carbonactinospora thermoautotrophica]
MDVHLAPVGADFVRARSHNATRVRGFARRCFHATRPEAPRGGTEQARRMKTSGQASDLSAPWRTWRPGAGLLTRAHDTAQARAEARRHGVREHCGGAHRPRPPRSRVRRMAGRTMDLIGGERV